MNYRYRVKGNAKSAFILRGMHFSVGGKVDNDILESELAFVKERCNITEIVDRQGKAAAPQPIPNSSTTPKGVKNELAKSASGANKSASKAKV